VGREEGDFIYMGEGWGRKGANPSRCHFICKVLATAPSTREVLAAALSFETFLVFSLSYIKVLEEF
jgi:hypothetical protein